MYIFKNHNILQSFRENLEFSDNLACEVSRFLYF